MTIRMPHGYAGVRTHSMNEFIPAHNGFFYVRSYQDYLDCRDARKRRIIKFQYACFGEKVKWS